MHPTKWPPINNRAVASFAMNVSETVTNCVLCKFEKHPLYACPRFKLLPHNKMIFTIRYNGPCLNCLKLDHLSRQCSSSSRCRKCQKPHYMLIHTKVKETVPPEQQSHVSTIGPVIATNVQAGQSPLHSVATFDIAAVSSPDEKLRVTRVVLPRVTCHPPASSPGLEMDTFISLVCTLQILTLDVPERLISSLG